MENVSTGRDTVAHRINDNANSVLMQPKSIKEFIIPPPTKTMCSETEHSPWSGKGVYYSRVVNFLVFKITVILKNIVVIIIIHCLGNC